jgi:hypothetical protein
VSGPKGARLRAAFGLWSIADWPRELASLRALRTNLGVTPASMPGVRIRDVDFGSAITSLALTAEDPTASVIGIDSHPVVEDVTTLRSVDGA